MAPSKAERSQISSVTRNFLARLKNAAGPLEALTAMTWRGLCLGSSGVEGEVVFDVGSLCVATCFCSGASYGAFSVIGVEGI
jgi:hypothetical protein